MFIYLDTLENYHFSKNPEIVFNKVDNDFESFCNNLEIKPEDVLLINSEILFGSGSNRQDLKGILLLKWLRISKRYINKIIVCGFLPLQNIIEKHPEHVILLARGTTYLQFPFNRSELDHAIYRTGSIEEGKLIEFYHPFVKADFNIERRGHGFANEFGLLLMQSVHELISGVRIECDYSKKYNTLDFNKAEFLYFSDIDRLKLTEDQENLIERLLNITVDDPSNPKKILFIDDQAELGWNKLFAGMIFNDPENSNLLTINKKEVINEQRISQFIRICKPSCVLLDLRLKGDDEINTPIEEISGYKVLKHIKRQFPSLPVIITSATNKAESLNALLKAGAEGLWTKPRVENIRHPSQLYDSYLDLINIVYEALTKFKTELDKTFFELDYHRFKIPENFSHANLQNSLFIFDTSYFICNECKYADYSSRIKGFMYLYNSLAEKNLKHRIYIIEDVHSELNKKSLGIIDSKIDSKSDEYLSIKFSAKYSQNLIKDFLESEVLFYNYTLENKLTNAHITYSIPPEKPVRLYKQMNILIDKFQSYEAAETEKDRLILLNKKTLLHADDTLKFVTSKMFLDTDNNRHIDNIYLITNDYGCNYNVYRYITNQKAKLNFVTKSPEIWFLRDRYNLKETEIFFTYHGIRRRYLSISESSKFLSVFDNFGNKL